MGYQPTLAGLSRGDTFRTRRELSAAFGGTPFRGISYNWDSDYVILVAGTPSPNAFNYRNKWLDESENEYEFYGEWHGCQDMSMTAGNEKIRDRSPNLYLFTFGADEYEFRGRFRYVSHEIRSTANPNCDNRPYKAIVFTLCRV